LRILERGDHTEVGIRGPQFQARRQVQDVDLRFQCVGFYEGRLSSPPSNPDVQWLIGSSLPYAHVMTFVMHNRFSCLLVADPSSCISEFKVGVITSEPVARSNFYPCRHQAGHHIPHARVALGPNPCYQRTPSLRTVARKQPADTSGALTFNSHDAPLWSTTCTSYPPTALSCAPCGITPSCR
jgi:hypothetical protein